MSSADVYQRVRDHWISQSINLLPPTEEEDILDAFSRNGRFPVSRDVIKLYRTVGGFRDYESDDEEWSLWPLSRVTDGRSAPTGAFIIFADFLIESHWYSVRYSNRETSEVFLDYGNGGGSEPLSASLESFLESYLQASPGQLFYFLMDGDRFRPRESRD
ncbi:MAG: hypothetical protein EXS05_08260 [Planctomycetaceae bacterium]|nr:hypothetical protein [Planctomycetaceae bacterium]